LPRFIYKDLFQSKIRLIFFVACFVWPLILALIIYLRYNVSALEMLDLPVTEIVSINNTFFLLWFFIPQSTLAFFLTAVVGPGLVSMDLANNALPLYLCRPFNRKDYVLGKLSVLAVLLSLITWVPGLFLVLLHTSLEGLGWLLANWWIAVAIFLSSWIWILILSLLTLAISAWVRWRPVAAAMLFGVFFVAAGFGEAVNQLLFVRWGKLLDLSELFSTVSTSLFRVDRAHDISVSSAWLAILIICGFCLLVLARRLKAFEVVK
jgi:ABC-2 type transport system permease protein